MNVKSIHSQNKEFSDVMNLYGRLNNYQNATQKKEAKKNTLNKFLDDYKNHSFNQGSI